MGDHWSPMRFLSTLPRIAPEGVREMWQRGLESVFAERFKVCRI